MKDVIPEASSTAWATGSRGRSDECRGRLVRPRQPRKELTGLGDSAGAHDGAPLHAVKHGLRDVPESLGIGGIEGIGGDASSCGVTMVDGGGFVAVVEVAAAEAFELRGGREQHRGGSTLL